MKYPNVLSEVETLKALHAGASIARYGDGELKLIKGGNCISQIYDRNLGFELAEALRNPGKCLIGIPNLNSPTPKAPGWEQYKTKPGYLELFSPKVAYVSSFITRPDSAPWIDTPDYWSSITALWRGRDIVLVKGTERSLRLGMMDEAKSVEEVSGPPRDAYAALDGIYDGLKNETRRVLICLGPAATILAWRLAQVGVHALDVGHVGMTMRKAGQYFAAWKESGSAVRFQ